MTTPPLLTLTTDFGVRESYVAQVKGAVLRLVPDVRFVDVVHDIAPGDIREAAYHLWTLRGRFPDGTLHLVVVDPGVGTGRSILRSRLGSTRVICPDNGIVTLVAPDLEEISAIRFPDEMVTNASRTFHGRDLFAPLAGWTIAGRDLSSMESAQDRPVLFPYEAPRVAEERVEGTLLHVDRFGNLITDLPASMKEGRLILGNSSVTLWSETYEAAPRGEPFAMIGSSGTVEVAVNRGRAFDSLGSPPVGSRVLWDGSISDRGGVD